MSLDSRSYDHLPSKAALALIAVAASGCTLQSWGTAEDGVDGGHETGTSSSSSSSTGPDAGHGGGGTGGSDVGGNGGGGGATAQCETVKDCDGPKVPACETVACETGVCVYKPELVGKIVADVKGNCQRVQCDGKGGTQIEADPSDIPDDGNECTKDTCDGDQPKHTPEPSGASCSKNDFTHCDGAGACNDCPGLPAFTDLDKMGGFVGYVFDAKGNFLPALSCPPNGSCALTKMVCLPPNSAVYMTTSNNVGPDADAFYFHTSKPAAVSEFRAMCTALTLPSEALAAPELNYMKADPLNPGVAIVANTANPADVGGERFFMDCADPGKPNVQGFAKLAP